MPRIAICAVFLLTSAAFAQKPADLSVTLAAPAGRTQFRVGEAIDLELQFSSSNPGQYQVWTNRTNRFTRETDPDRFTVEPASGAVDPLRDSPDQMSAEAVAGPLPRPVALQSQPLTVPLALNEWFSIRQPGHYRISVETNRAQPVAPHGPDPFLPVPTGVIPLRSNSLEIEVVAAEPDWANDQLQKAVATLEVADAPVLAIGQRFDLNHVQAHNADAARAGQILRFLETKEAAAAIVRFFENGPQGAQRQLRAGLFSSPYRDEVQAAMEAALAAPERAVTTFLLNSLVQLEDLRRYGPAPPYTARGPEEIRRYVNEVSVPHRDKLQPISDHYLAQLSQALGGKRGSALAVSLDTMIVLGGAPPAPATVKALTDNFAALPAFTQQSYLADKWAKIASPAITPFVKLIAEGPSDLRDAALLRLRDLDPAAARAIALDRVRRTDVTANIGGIPRAVLSLPDQSLPDLDGTMVAALEQGKRNADLLVARYASAAVLPRVRSLIESGAASICSPLSAYVFRVDAALAADFVKQARARTRRACPLLQSGATDSLMSPGLERQAIADLSDPNPNYRLSAQTILQESGSGSAERALWDAVSHLRDQPPVPGDWSEFGLMNALANSPGWNLSGPEIDKLAATCITDNCRSRMASVRRMLTQPIDITPMEMPGGNYAMIAGTTLHSRAQLEQKVAAFTRGTRFTVWIPGDTWWGGLRSTEIRKILDDAGMLYQDGRPRPAVR